VRSFFHRYSISYSKASCTVLYCLVAPLCGTWVAACCFSHYCLLSGLIWSLWLMAQKCTPDTFTVSCSSFQRDSTSPTELPAVFCTPVCLQCACHEPSSTMELSGSRYFKGCSVYSENKPAFKTRIISKTSCNEITKWRSKEKINS